MAGPFSRVWQKFTKAVDNAVDNGDPKVLVHQAVLDAESQHAQAQKALATALGTLRMAEQGISSTSDVPTASVEVEKARNHVEATERELKYLQANKERIIFEHAQAQAEGKSGLWSPTEGMVSEGGRTARRDYRTSSADAMFVQAERVDDDDHAEASTPTSADTVSFSADSAEQAGKDRLQQIREQMGRNQSGSDTL